jgi:hypothetical protein
VTAAWKNKELGARESKTSDFTTSQKFFRQTTRARTHKQTNWGLKQRRRRRSSSSSRSGTAEQSKQTCSSLESIPCCKEDSQPGNFIFIEQQATNKLEEHKGTEQENTIWSIWIQHQIRNFLLSLKKTFSTNKLMILERETRRWRRMLTTSKQSSPCNDRHKCVVLTPGDRQTDDETSLRATTW